MERWRAGRRARGGGRGRGGGEGGPRSGEVIKFPFWAHQWPFILGNRVLVNCGRVQQRKASRPHYKAGLRAGSSSSFVNPPPALLPVGCRMTAGGVCGWRLLGLVGVLGAAAAAVAAVAAATRRSPRNPIPKPLRIALMRSANLRRPRQQRRWPTVPWAATPRACSMRATTPPSARAHARRAAQTRSTRWRT